MPPEVSPLPIPRRNALTWSIRAAVALGTAAGAATYALWAAATGRFLMPNAIATPSSRFHAGGVADYPRGTVATKYRESHGVWLVHVQNADRWEICALRTRCTHLGCITIWLDNDSKFKCPCHGSGFRIDGVNIEGPAPRPLERCAIRLLANGQLEVDTSRIFRQEMGQWTDPASYVTTDA